MDIATLGIAINSKQVVGAVGDLRSLEAQAARTEGVAKRLTGVFGALAAGMVSALSVGALTSAFTATIDAMDRIGRSAQKIGIPVEELSQLEYAARLADVSLGQLETGVSTLSRQLSAIGAGGRNGASAAFAAMGISAKDAEGKLKPTSKILEDVANKFQSYRDGAEKTALANAIFGRSGRELIPLLNQGAAGIATMKQEADDFGLTLSGSAYEAVDTFNDNIDRMKGFLQGVAATAASELLPAINNLSGGFFDAIPSAKSLGEAIGTTLRDAMVDFIAVGMEGAQVLRTLATLVGAFNEVSNNGGLFSEKGSQIWSEAMDRIRNDTEDTRASIEAMYNTASDPSGSLASLEKLLKPLRGVSTEGRDAPFVRVGGDKPARAKKEKVDPDIAEARRIYESILTPMEAYIAKQKELKRLLDEGHILQTTHNLAVADAQAEYVKAEGALKTMAVSQQDLLNNIDHYANIVEGARDVTKGFFADLRGNIENGKSLWGSLRDTAINALGSIADKMLNSGIDGFFDSLASSGSHPLYGGGGGFLSGLLDFLPGFATGADRVPRDMVARIHKDEMIIPKVGADAIRGGKVGGSSSPNVNFQINNYSKAEVTPHADGGGFDIIDAVSNVIASGGADKAMRRFNVTPGRIVR